MANKNAAFQEYIDVQIDAMNAAATTAQADMDAAIAQFYKDGAWDDAQPVVSGSYQQLDTASSWSLDPVIAMIDAVYAAMSGGPAAPPARSSPFKACGAGTKIQTPIPGMSNLKGTFMSAAIPAAAFAVIENILAGFASSTNTMIARNFSEKTLAPGLMLFVTVIENQYHSSDFFSGEAIIQILYIFNARYSVKQAGAVRGANQVQLLVAQQAAFEQRAVEVSDLIARLDVTRDDYQVALRQLQKILDLLNDYIDRLQKKIAA